MTSDLIMVVDDDVDLRELYAETLIRRGFKVRAFPSAKEALEQIFDGPRKYCLIITDVMMNGIDGPLLANKINEINRDIKIILISGFDYKVMDLSHCHYDKFIQIPITLSEFLSTVNEVLELPPSISPNKTA